MTTHNLRGNSMNAPAQRLQRYIDEGRLIRGSWHEGPRGPDGYERASLRVALYPDADGDGGAEACPEEMPQWLAELMPWMNTAGTLNQWPTLMHRFAAIAHRWHVLDVAAWRRALLRSLATIVGEARGHTTSPEVVQVCDVVIDLCREGAAADDVRWEESARAARVAVAAVWAEARAGVKWSAAEGAWWAARAGKVDGVIARKMAADRIISGILTAIEHECLLEETKT